MSRGRGRGRGRGQAFHLQQVGLSPGEAPPAILQPPPLFPDLERKPLQCKRNESDNYMLSVKQEFRAAITNGPLYIKLVNKQSFEIERYSDRYRRCTGQNKANLNTALIPKELLTVSRHKTKQTKKRKVRITSNNLAVDQLKEESSENESGEEQPPADTLYDEEQEEEGDYQLTYFDDGEDYGGDEDDNLDDGPCY